MITLRNWPHPALALLIVALTPALRGDEEASFRYSHSANNPLLRGATVAGDVGVDAGFFDWRSSAAVSDAVRINYGVSWASYHFSRGAALAVPTRLQEISLRVGAGYRFDSRWMLMASVQPGLYGDLGGSAHDAFNAPALLLATFRQNPGLAWSFGLRADPFADQPVLPLVGVNWRFAPQWVFNLGLPRAGFSYEATPALKLGAGATVQGGSFRVAADPRAAPPLPRLDDTFLDYREIRAGLSVDYRFASNLTLSMEAGIITDQKFDYYEQGHTLNGDTAAFFTLGLSGRF